MTGHKDFIEDRVKTEKGTLSEGVRERHKDWIWDRVCGKNRDATKENIKNQRHGV